MPIGNRPLIPPEGSSAVCWEYLWISLNAFALPRVSYSNDVGGKDVKPFTCICCGVSYTDQSKIDSQNPNVCVSCGSLVGDEQDNMIIESAIPLEVAETLDEPKAPANRKTDSAARSNTSKAKAVRGAN